TGRGRRGSPELNALPHSATRSPGHRGLSPFLRRRYNGSRYDHEHSRGAKGPPLAAGDPLARVVRCGVNLSEQPPSKQWATLTKRGETVADVWFKPEGEPLALTFRIPQQSFHIPDVGQRLTVDNLLKAVGIATEEVESWRHEGASPSGMHGPSSELGHPLPPPPQDVTHLNLYVSLKPPPPAVAPDEGREPEIPEATWQTLEGRWNAILGLEASIETLRISMEALRAEMEATSRKTLTADEKLHALNADVAQWNKAKSRAHFALPKAREFIHRSTWAAGTPERKKLEELFKTHIRPRIPFP